MRICSVFHISTVCSLPTFHLSFSKWSPYSFGKNIPMTWERSFVQLLAARICGESMIFRPGLWPLTHSGTTGRSVIALIGPTLSKQRGLSNSLLAFRAFLELNTRRTTNIILKFEPKLTAGCVCMLVDLLWCDLGCCFRTVVVIKATAKNRLWRRNSQRFRGNFHLNSRFLQNIVHICL